MRHFFSGALAMMLFAVLPCLAHAAVEPSADQMTAAGDLLSTMHMDTTMANATTLMLDMQIKQNPTLGAYRQVMLDFLNKYMGWGAVKDDMARIYAQEFTVDELQELNTFYKTPLGQKLVSKESFLMSKGAEFGQKRVAAHSDELRQAIEAQSKKSQH